MFSYNSGYTPPWGGGTRQLNAGTRWKFTYQLEKLNPISLGSLRPGFHQYRPILGHLMALITTYGKEWAGTYHRSCSPQGRVVEYKSPPYLFFNRLDVHTDLNSNPNWKIDIAKKRDASRRYRKARCVAELPLRATFHYTSGHAPNLTTGFVTAGSYWSANLLRPYDDTLRDIALSRIKRKLASHTKEMQGVVPLVELRELRDLIKYLTTQTTTFVVALLSIMKNPLNGWNYRKLGKAAFEFKIYEAWLAWSFAIKPTLSDIDAAVQAVKNYLSEPPRSLVLKGTAKSKWVTSQQDYSGFFGINVGANLANTYKYEHSLVYTYTGGFDINLLSSNTYNPPGESYNLPGFLDQFGLTPEKLPGSVWELIPLSWLFDYFGTIGAFLDDAFESSAGSTRYCTLSRLYKCKIQRTATIVADGSTRIGLNKVTGGYYEYVDFERSVHQTLPHRSLRFKTADEIGVNGVNRLLNLLAVLASGSKPFRG